MKKLFLGLLVGVSFAAQAPIQGIIEFDAASLVEKKGAELGNWMDKLVEHLVANPASILTKEEIEGVIGKNEEGDVMIKEGYGTLLGAWLGWGFQQNKTTGPLVAQPVEKNKALFENAILLADKLYDRGLLDLLDREMLFQNFFKLESEEIPSVPPKPRRGTMVVRKRPKVLESLAAPAESASPRTVQSLRGKAIRPGTARPEWLDQLVKRVDESTLNS